MKGSALAAYALHVVLLNFIYAYKLWLGQSGLKIVAFILSEFAAEHQDDEHKLTEMNETLCWYSSSAVVEVQYASPMIS